MPFRELPIRLRLYILGQGLAILPLAGYFLLTQAMEPPNWGLA
jgi:hypothetical protein